MCSAYWEYNAVKSINSVSFQSGMMIDVKNAEAAMRDLNFQKYLSYFHLLGGGACLLTIDHTRNESRYNSMRAVEHTTAEADQPRDS